MSKPTLDEFSKDEKSSKFKKKPFKKWKSGKSNRKVGNPTNSPEWYYPMPEIQHLAAAVNMNFKNGNKVSFADGVNLSDSSWVVNHMPGVYANPIMHVPGRATAPTDPVNEASRSIVNKIRECINATRTYEMPDIVKYLLAIADLHAWIEFMKTVYRTCNNFNPLNRYTPLAILRGMHIDTSDVNNMRIQMKFYLETLQQRVANLKLPTEVTVVLSWIEDFKHIYCDEDIAKAQYIVNVPEYILKYTIDTSTGKSKLVPKDFRSVFSAYSPATVNDLKAFTEDLLSELLNDEDFAIITGDLMKTYQSFYDIDLGNLDTTIEYEYSKEFLEKWHNSCQCNAYSRSHTGWEVTEASSTSMDPYIVFNPLISCADAAQLRADRRGAANRYLDFYDREVTADQIINGTLWMYSVINIDETNKTYEIDSVGTTIVGPGEIWYYNASEQLVFNSYNGSVYFDVTANSKLQVDRYGIAGIMVQLSKFNYHPLTILVILNNAATSTDVGYFGVIGDFGNYTILDRRVMENIKTCVLYGQFNVKKFLQ